MKKLICNEVARCQPVTLRTKLFPTSSFTYFAYIFSKCIKITFFEEASKVWEHNFFQEIQVQSSYLEFTCSIRIHPGQLSSCWIWHLAVSWVHFSSNKLEFVFVFSRMLFLAVLACSTMITRTSLLGSVIRYVLF